VFTGCDSVSAFKGKGKIKALQLLLDNSDFIEAFGTSGCEFDDVPDELIAVLERFVCHLYNQKLA